MSSQDRPTFPKRAIITGGMPYGNKNLHFGHIGGVFVPADFFARFLRDRIGAENVGHVYSNMGDTEKAESLYKRIREKK